MSSHNCLIINSIYYTTCVHFVYSKVLSTNRPKYSTRNKMMPAQCFGEIGTFNSCMIRYVVISIDKPSILFVYANGQFMGATRIHSNFNSFEWNVRSQFILNLNSSFTLSHTIVRRRNKSTPGSEFMCYKFLTHDTTFRNAFSCL